VAFPPLCWNFFHTTSRGIEEMLIISESELSACEKAVRDLFAKDPSLAAMLHQYGGGLPVSFDASGSPFLVQEKGYNSGSRSYIIPCPTLLKRIIDADPDVLQGGGRFIIYYSGAMRARTKEFLLEWHLPRTPNSPWRKCHFRPRRIEHRFSRSAE